LPDQRLRRQDQYGLGAEQRHQLRRQRELDGLAESDLVRQHQARAVRTAVGIEGELDEVLLVRPEPILAAVQRQLHDGCGGLRRGLPVGQVRHHDTGGDARDVLHHRLAQIQREGGLPQRVELLLHPVHGSRVVVLPQQLVVQPPGGLRLVDAAEEGAPAAVRGADDAGLAVDQAEVGIRQHPDLELAAC
jgi:hypothetical protein